MTFIFLLSLLGYISCSTDFELKDGYLFYRDLNPGQRLCRFLSLPKHRSRVLIHGSVVGLTGNPYLIGSFDDLSLESIESFDAIPMSGGGFHTLKAVKDVPDSSNKYWFCVTALGSQVSDFVLTASVSAPNESLPLYLLPNIPIVWSIDSIAYFQYFTFHMPETWEGINWSLTVLEGRMDLEISSCDGIFSDRFDAESSIVGSLPGNPPPCLTITARGRPESLFSLVFFNSSPFAIQGVPQASSSGVRLIYKPDTEIGISAKTIEGIPMTITAKAGTSSWTGTDPGRLVFTPMRTVFGDSSSATDDFVKVIAGYETVVYTSSGIAESVETIEDGLTVFSEERQHYRFWVSSGPISVKFFSHSGLRVFAYSGQETWSTGNFMSIQPSCKHCWLYFTVEAGKHSLSVTSWDGLSVLDEGFVFKHALIGNKTFKFYIDNRRGAESLVIAAGGVDSLQLMVSKDRSMMSGESVECSNQCRISIPADSPLRRANHLYVQVANVSEISEDEKFEIYALYEMSSLDLKTNLTISLKFGESEKYSCMKISEFLSLQMDGKGPVPVLSADSGDKQISDRGSIDFDCQGVCPSLHFLAKCEKSPSCEFTLNPIFISSSDRVTVGEGSSNFRLSDSQSEWMVEGLEDGAWIAEIWSETNLNACVRKTSTCCTAPCRLAGLGNDMIVLSKEAENESLIGSITVSRFDLIPGIWNSIPEGLRILEIPRSVCFIKTDPDSSVLLSSSFDGPFENALTETGETGGYVEVDFGTKMIFMEICTFLHEGEWADMSSSRLKWNKNISGKIVVESCAPYQDQSTVNSLQIDAPTTGELILNKPLPSSPTRVGLFSENSIFVKNVDLYLFFETEIAGYYRAVAISTGGSDPPSGCQFLNGVRGDWKKCEVNQICVISLPRGNWVWATAEAKGGQTRFKIVKLDVFNNLFFGRMFMVIGWILKMTGWGFIACLLIYFFKPIIFMHFHENYVKIIKKLHKQDSSLLGTEMKSDWVLGLKNRSNNSEKQKIRYEEGVYYRMHAHDA